MDVDRCVWLSNLVYRARVMKYLTFDGYYVTLLRGRTPLPLRLGLLPASLIAPRLLPPSFSPGR